MKLYYGILPTVLMVFAAAEAVSSDPKETPPPPENKCLLCHGNADLWEGEQLRFFITEKDLAHDIHWQRGLRCWDCHGGNPHADELLAAHSAEDHFRTVKSPADVPKFCGECHANIEYMRRYQPSPRTDQLAEYWTSGHGQRLKATGDPKVATCISCHDKPHGSAQDKTRHGILPVTDLDSPVYRTHVAATCAKCHADRQLMKGRLFHGRPLPCDQYAKWRQSVHGKALMDKGDLSAPTCNDCHGNHGAVPPQVDTVANACGTCHGKVANLFEQARMKHEFEEVGLPGCATCHGSHDITQPSDEMLGMSGGAVCARCHGKGKYGATIAGSVVARTLRSDLERLKSGIHTAEETLDAAERLGMEVSQPRFELRAAVDDMTNARSLIHTFHLKPVETALAGGAKVVSVVQKKAEHALHEHTARRIWLAASLIPILLVIVLLLLYIRTLPAPRR